MAGAWVRDLGTNTVAGGLNTSLALTTTHAVNSGDTVVVFLKWNSNLAGLSVSDGTNTYNIDLSDNDANGFSIAICSFYYPTGLASGATITASWTNATGVAAIAASEFSGLLTAAWLDKTAVGTSNAGTTPTSGATATLSQAAEVAVGAVVYYYTGSTPATISGGGFTALTGANLNVSGFEEGVLPAYQILSSTAAVTFAPTLSQTATFAKAGVVTYKASSFPPVPEGVPAQLEHMTILRM